MTTENITIPKMPDMMENHHFLATTATRQPNLKSDPAGSRLDDQSGYNKKKTPSQNQRSDHTFPLNPLPQRARKKSAADRQPHARRDGRYSATSVLLHSRAGPCQLHRTATLLTSNIRSPHLPIANNSQAQHHYLPYTLNRLDRGRIIALPPLSKSNHHVRRCRQKEEGGNPLLGHGPRKSAPLQGRRGRQ